VVKTAARLSEQLKRDVVPMFWIAGDDHDFAEANHTWVLNRQSQPTRIQYDAPPEEAWPTAEITLANEVELAAAKEALTDALGQSDFTDELFDLIDRCYSPSETMVTAFGKLLAALTHEYGLILFSPGDKEVKRHAVPFFLSLLEKQDMVRDALAKTNDELVRSGYHLQVEKDEEAVHLFYNLEGRTPLKRDGDEYVVGDHRFTKGELIERIQTTPEKFSPDVFSKPLLQSFLFPVVEQKCGPSELAYLAQVNPLFELFDLVVPQHHPRATATVVETRFEKMLDDFELSFEDLSGDIEEPINRILAESFPPDLQSRFTTLRTDISGLFNEFVSETLSFDPALKDFSRQTHGKIDFALKNFDKKVFSSHKKKSGDVRDRIYRLHHTLFMNRSLQERSLNLSYFVARYGFGVIEGIFQLLEPDERAHQLLHISDMDL
jgi:bacillithiol biosynthesis cysteine-adding enzyme BshC